ncbi:upf0503 protein at3g09070 chloroplastic [Phtheirospermum japonicum]|uniref:Upf0503 protein at3g09070 chloroplastic n=1 Tax=Phtheirospermum japonicum TaxID=374723 RepID=A0A830D6P9_9LAMI|nr:upf0503 protein at3g09070 chloroplastic [Phtheirospermum japonicum]
MTLRPDSRSRARTRTGIRNARRISPCYRHPDEPVTGICASCLRERLSGLDDAAPDAASPELRRCRSVVAISKCEASSSSLNEPRRKSCDVVSSRSSLCNLFDVDDLKSGSECEAKVESKNVGKNVGLSKVTYTVIESKSEKDNNNNNNHDEIRVSSRKLGELNAGDVDSDGDSKEGEFKTMKEYIDLEFQTKTKKSKDFREIAGNFLGAASVFTRKLRNWRQNNSTSKIKNHKNSSNCNVPKLGEGHNSEIVGRRSCDTEPRFSVDAGPTPFEEPRASWDGYMIARTIPRLAPMFSVVENGILGNMSKFENRRLSVDGPTMHSIVEDESSSGASGSGHSNSDSSSSMRRSSFDRSSSVRSFGKKAVTSPANVKLVITEKELKDWHLRDGLEKFGPTDNESVGKLNGPAKKTVRWRKVCNVLGFGPKNSESNANAMDPGGGKLTRSTSVVGPRNIPCDVVESNYRRRSVDNAGGYDFKLERNTSGKYGSDDLGDGMMPVPFYMTPLRSLKHCKSGKFELRKSPLSVDGNVLRLN